MNKNYLRDDSPTLHETQDAGDRVVGWMIILVLVIFGALCWATGEVEAATSNSYYRITLGQGTLDIGYGQGATMEAAWSDCQRLAAIPRALTAAETRLRAAPALTGRTVRVCKGPMWYVTTSPDTQPVACSAPPAPTTEARACPAGTTGTWFQVGTTTYGPAPSCTPTVTWTPASAPAGQCTPEVVVPSGTATLSWSHDGANSEGFRVVYGLNETTLSQTVQINDPRARNYTVSGLPAGAYYFAVKAFGVGGESSNSNVVQKAVR